MTEQQAYLIIRAETNGFSVQHNSMYALAGVVINIEKQVLAAFQYRFEKREGTTDSTDLFSWLSSEQQQNILKGDKMPIEKAMHEIQNMLLLLTAQHKIYLTLSGNNALYDFQFFDYYMRMAHGTEYIPLYQPKMLDVHSYSSGMSKDTQPNNESVNKAIQDGYVLNPQDGMIAFNDSLDSTIFNAVCVVDMIRENTDVKWTPLKKSTVISSSDRKSWLGKTIQWNSENKRQLENVWIMTK
jgi:hypothetical protein